MEQLFVRTFFSREASIADRKTISVTGAKVERGQGGQKTSYCDFYYT